MVAALASRHRRRILDATPLEAQLAGIRLQLGLDSQNRIQISLYPACEALGLSGKSQIDKLKKCAWAKVHLVHLSCRGGCCQPQNCLSASDFAAWLCSIDLCRVSATSRRLLLRCCADLPNLLAHLASVTGFSGSTIFRLPPAQTVPNTWWIDGPYERIVELLDSTGIDYRRSPDPEPAGQVGMFYAQQLDHAIMKLGRTTCPIDRLKDTSRPCDIDANWLTQPHTGYELTEKLIHRLLHDRRHGDSELFSVSIEEVTAALTSIQLFDRPAPRQPSIRTKSTLLREPVLLDIVHAANDEPPILPSAFEQKPWEQILEPYVPSTRILIRLQEVLR